MNFVLVQVENELFWSISARHGTTNAGPEKMALLEVAPTKILGVRKKSRAKQVRGTDST